MSDQDTNMFAQEGEQKTVEGDNQQQSQQSDYTDFLKEVVNENGEPKYRDLESALKSIPHSQEHIQRLERENAELRKVKEEMGSVKELLEQLKTNQPQQPTTSGTKAELDPELIAKMVTSTLQTEKQKEQMSQNISTVRTTLLDSYGDSAARVWNEKAAELGFTPEEFTQLAAQKPKAVLSYFKTEKQETPPKTSSQFNSAGFQNQSRSAEKRSIMGPTTDAELKAEWNRIRDEVMKDFGG